MTRNEIIDDIIAKMGDDFEKDMLEAGKGHGDEFYEGMSMGLATAASKLEDLKEA